MGERRGNVGELDPLPVVFVGAQPHRRVDGEDLLTVDAPDRARLTGEVPGDRPGDLRVAGDVGVTQVIGQDEHNVRFGGMLGCDCGQRRNSARAPRLDNRHARALFVSDERCGNPAGFQHACAGCARARSILHRRARPSRYARHRVAPPPGTAAPQAGRRCPCEPAACLPDYAMTKASPNERPRPEHQHQPRQWHSTCRRAT